MLSKIIHYFDRSKKDIFREFSEEHENYDKSMEWQDDDDDRRSISSFSWSGKNFLARSKSDLSININEDCNHRTQSTQVSIKSCNTAKNVASILENLNLNDESDDIIDDDTPTMIVDYPTYNQFDYASYHYSIKTKDVTTEEIIMQKPEVLNFQGNRHTLEEIAPYWKKDCRMWLWKSVRLAHRNNQTSIVFM